MTAITLDTVLAVLKSRPRKVFTRWEVSKALGADESADSRASVIWCLCRLVELKKAKDGTPAGPKLDSTWKAVGEK